MPRETRMPREATMPLLDRPSCRFTAVCFFEGGGSCGDYRTRPGIAFVGSEGLLYAPCTEQEGRRGVIKRGRGEGTRVRSNGRAVAGGYQTVGLFFVHGWLSRDDSEAGACPSSPEPISSKTQQTWQGDVARFGRTLPNSAAEDGPWS